MEYYLGLDNGGTSTKAAIYDEHGKEIISVGEDSPMSVPRPGYAERDMEDMWQVNCRVIKGALEGAGLTGDDIACVAVCGHGKGLYLWGMDDAPVRPGILSADNRAWKYAAQWKEDGTEEKIFDISYQHIMGCQPVALLRWLMDNEPGAVERTKWIFACKDYIRFRLTGEARAERTDYSGCNLLNLKTGEYDPRLLSLFGLEGCMEKLPPLVNAAEICGSITPQAAALTGLRVGTPVAGGAFDIDACALAVGVTDSSRICMIAGTWSINEYPAPTPITDGSVLMNSLFCLPGRYLIEESSPTSAGNSTWFMKSLLPEVREECRASGKSVYETMNGWVEEIPPEELCPIYLPFIMASNVHPNASGAFVGINSYHTRKHLLRGLYEGIAFSHRYHLEKLLKTRAEAPASIRLAGGVARSPMWTQMFADVMGLPVERVAVNETGAAGCAVIAAVACGKYSDMAQAAEHMCSISPAVMPDPVRKAIYDRKYALYLKTIQCLDGLWDDMASYGAKA